MTATRDMRLATTLIGSGVRNRDGDDLGTIDDLLVDVGHPTGVLAIIQFGGLLGFGGKTYAVPVEALAPGGDGDHFVLGASTELVQRAPEFNADRFADYNDDATLNSLRDHYVRS